MADNITLNTGTGGAVVKTDDDGTAHWQYTKMAFGADNTQTRVTSSVGLPTDPLDRAGRDLGKVDIAMGQGAHDAAGSAIDPVAVGGYASAAAPSDVSADGDICRIWTTLKGAVNVADAGGSLTVDGTVTANLAAGTNNIGDVDVLSVPAPLSTTGGGTEATALRVTLANDSTGVIGVDDNGGALTVDNGGTFAVQESGAALTALQLIDNCIFVDDSGFTPGTSSVAVIGAQADDASTDSVNEGDAGALRMTLDRKLIVSHQPHTLGGLTVFRTLDADETEEDVKTTAGQLYGYYIANLHASSFRYVKFYNATAANVTVGTTTPLLTLPIPPGAAAHVEFSMGIAFGTAISVAATTGVADNDTGAPGANEVVVNAFYN